CRGAGPRCPSPAPRLRLRRTGVPAGATTPTTRRGRRG
ncbi:MAG: hypothetical protein AVDCRST_MAG19-4607, partial [uncultured Thermomicrobiales bacterium]